MKKKLLYLFCLILICNFSFAQNQNWVSTSISYSGNGYPKANEHSIVGKNKRVYWANSLGFNFDKKVSYGLETRLIIDEQFRKGNADYQSNRNQNYKLGFFIRRNFELHEKVKIFVAGSLGPSVHKYYYEYNDNTEIRKSNAESFAIDLNFSSGINYKFKEKWSAEATYGSLNLTQNFEKNETSNKIEPDYFSGRFNMDMNSLRIGVNYHF